MSRLAEQLSRHREWAQTRREDDALVRHQRQESNMKTRKTPVGDRVQRFPDVSDRAERLAEVRQKLADAFEEAERAQAVQGRMTAAGKPDPARFSSLRDGGAR